MPRTSKTADKTLTVQQAADRLGVARLHVWRLVEQGEIPSLLVDGEKRIRRSDLPAVRNMFSKGVGTLEDFIAGRRRTANIEKVGQS